MAKKQETIFRESVVRWLEGLPHCKIFSISQSAIRGTPDLLVCLTGKFLGIEIKATGKSKISKLQEFHLRGINDALGMGIIIHPGNFCDARLKVGKLIDYDQVYSKRNNG